MVPKVTNKCSKLMTSRAKRAHKYENDGAPRTAFIPEIEKKTFHRLPNVWKVIYFSPSPTAEWRSRELYFSIFHVYVYIYPIQLAGREIPSYVSSAYTIQYNGIILYVNRNFFRKKFLPLDRFHFRTSPKLQSDALIRRIRRSSFFDE